MTSTTRQRRWKRGDRELHHLLNPATGLPLETDLVAVTVVTRAAWWGEALAKHAMLVGSARAAEVIERWGATAVLVGHDGSAQMLSGIVPFLSREHQASLVSTN